MNRQTRLGHVAVVALCLLGLAGCAAPLAVKSYAEPGVDFSRYRTYNWASEKLQATGDPRLDNNPFFRDRVQADVEKHLATRGFEKTRSAPQVLVHYHASITQELDVQAIDRTNDYCNNCKPYAYDEGTLLIDLVDARTKQLLWRGWAKGSMDGVIDNQDWMDEKIDKAVARILDKLPSRL